MVFFISTFWWRDLLHGTIPLFRVLLPIFKSPSRASTVMCFDVAKSVVEGYILMRKKEIWDEHHAGSYSPLPVVY